LDNHSGAYDWAVEFAGKVKTAVEAHDAKALAEQQKWGEALLATAHPTVEHYLPVLYCMGVLMSTIRCLTPMKTSTSEASPCG
jgi:aromatic ring-opening dioxygenase catalytic subunit (LigB family)